MTCVVSAFVIAITQGAPPDFVARWLRSCALTWPVAFPKKLTPTPLLTLAAALEPGLIEYFTNQVLFGPAFYFGVLEAA